MSAALLQMRGISKAFAGVPALEDVQLTLRSGEIHGLMGENGAGKSTLIKVLTGVHARDRGVIEFDGREVSPRSPKEAEAHGISTVYQEVNLIPPLSIAENIMLGRQPKKFGIIQWSAMRRQAARALERLGLALDVTRELRSCSIALQQMVAIARALDVQARLLILDEPTSSLDEQESAALFAVMRRLRGEGLAILFVTHFLDQVYAVADRITVLRNGGFVGEFETASLPRLELIGKMLGREVRDERRAAKVEAGASARSGASRSCGLPLLPPREERDGERRTVNSARLPLSPTLSPSDSPRCPPSRQGAGAAGGAREKPTEDYASTNDFGMHGTQTSAPPFLEVKGLARRGAMQPLDLTIAEGEIVGLAGLLGSGRTETARMIFGVDRPDSGEIRLRGEPVSLRSPREAMRRGLAFCSEDRKTEGILPNLSVRENLILALQASRGPVRLLRRAEQLRIVDHYIRLLAIKTASPETPIRALSGGNQQKVLLARWLALQPKLIILDEPTRGIDVGAKAEIEKLVESLREKGLSVLFISSELEEVVRVCQRVVVLRDRKKVGELAGADVEESRIMSLIAHHDAGPELATSGNAGRLKR